MPTAQTTPRPDAVQTDLDSGCSISLHAHTRLVPWESDGLRLHVLGSGSQGNCCVVECPDGLVLIDAGISCKQICTRMEALGLNPARIKAILVTHEHSDHIGGLRVTTKKLRVPVYASEGTHSSQSWIDAAGPMAETLTPRSPLNICGIKITPFAVPHDAAEPLGYRFERSGDAIGYCTDLGHLTEEAGTYLADARIIALESNHDTSMLWSYAGYPHHLKARIAGDNGHLSNAQAAQALPTLATSRTETIVAMHVSQHTNLPTTCRTTLLHGRRDLDAAAGQLRVMVASQITPLSCL